MRHTRTDNLNSPNPDAPVRLEEELFVRLHFECVIPSIDVPHHAVNAILPRRMRVAHHLATDGVVADFPTPGLGPAEKNALLAAQTVDHRRGLAFQRSAISVECDHYAAEVGNVFAHGQFAVNLRPGQRLKL